MAVAKRKRCKTCQYRSASTDLYGCDFMLITGKRRGCPVDDCNRYIKGEKIRNIDALRVPRRKKTEEE